MPLPKRQENSRDELIAIHKRIYRKNARKIIERTEIPSKVFKAYEQEYKRYSRNYDHPIALDELEGHILANDIIYVGDYHTLKQAQRTLIRFLRDSYPQYPNILIAVETVSGKHQNILDEYLAGDIEEEQFVEDIEYIDHWMFNTWPNYKPIFEFAKDNQLPIIALDHMPSGSGKLYKRDDYAAKRIAKAAAMYPTHKIFVLFGELHISPNHLPKATNRYLKEKGEKRSSLIIFQNCERIYWKLVERKLEHKVDIVKIKKNIYSMMNTPPLICQQSYLNWLEHEEGTIEFNAPVKNFKSLTRRITEFLEIDIEDALVDVEVFTCNDFSFLEQLEEDKVFSVKEIKEIKKHLLESESYYIPKKRFVYLANLSLNHAGEEASHFIRHACSGDEHERTLEDSFYLRVVNEAVGFFGSKIVNHKRKAPTLIEFEEDIQRFQKKKKLDQEKVAVEIAKFVIVHKKLETHPRASTSLKRLVVGDRQIFIAVTHILGYMLGNDLYSAMVAGKVSKTAVRKLYFDPLADQGDPQRIYFDWVKQLSDLGFSY